MITKWWKKILEYLPVSITNMSYGPQIKNIDGVTRFLFSRTGKTPWLQTNVYFNTSGSDGFRVGMGATPPTDQDYALDSVITAGLTGRVVSDTPPATRDANGNVVSSWILTLQNTSSSDITVSEVGYYGNQSCSNTDGGVSSNQLVMYFRDVLNNPVTIAAGDTVAINVHMKVFDSDNA